MKFVTALIALLAGLLYTMAFAAGPDAKLQSITLDRSMCFGSCPDYALTLRSDGSATFVGRRFAVREGTYSGHFWSNDFEKLEKALGKSGFKSMKNRYTVTYTDQATQTVTAVWPGGTKKVEEYGPSGPDELWTIQKLIDGISANISDWKKAP